MFFFSEYWVGAKLSSMKGPVPTGCVLASFTGSLMLDHRCCGTIGVCAIEIAKGTLAAEKFIVTSLPLAEMLVICCHTAFVSSAGNFFKRLKVKTTSAGLKSLPSLHLTPCRMV